MDRFSKGLRELETLFSQNMASQVYRQAKCLNWSGPRDVKKRRYSDQFAEVLLNYLRELGAIQPNNRSQPYRCCNHDGPLNRSIKLRLGKEKHTVRAIFNEHRSGVHRLQDLEGCLGDLIDYEVPLKAKMHNDPVGKIDLLGVTPNEKTTNLTERQTRAANKTVNLIEFKILPVKSKGETLLRTVMEIFTYFQLLQREKLQGEYVDQLGAAPGSAGFRLVVCSQSGSLSAREMGLLRGDRYPSLYKLIQELTNIARYPFLFCSFAIEPEAGSPGLVWEGETVRLGSGIHKVVIRKIEEVKPSVIS